MSLQNYHIFTIIFQVYVWCHILILIQQKNAFFKLCKSVRKASNSFAD